MKWISIAVFSVTGAGWIAVGVYAAHWLLTRTLESDEIASLVVSVVVALGLGAALGASAVGLSQASSSRWRIAVVPGALVLFGFAIICLAVALMSESWRGVWLIPGALFAVVSCHSVARTLLRDARWSRDAGYN